MPEEVNSSAGLVYICKRYEPEWYAYALVSLDLTLPNKSPLSFCCSRSFRSCRTAVSCRWAARRSLAWFSSSSFFASLALLCAKRVTGRIRE